MRSEASFDPEAGGVFSEMSFDPEADSKSVRSEKSFDPEGGGFLDDDMRSERSYDPEGGAHTGVVHLSVCVRARARVFCLLCTSPHQEHVERNVCLARNIIILSNHSFLQEMREKVCAASVFEDFGYLQCPTSWSGTHVQH